MGTKARALYDFEGIGDELSFHADDILTVTSQDIGDGWLEGKDQNGQVGLFPESYVEIMTSTYDSGLNEHPVPQQATSNESYNEGNYAPPVNEDLPLPPPDNQYEGTKEAEPTKSQDGDFDDDDDDWSKNWGVDPVPSNQPVENESQSYTQVSRCGSVDAGSPVKRTDRKTTVKLGMNLFSPFTKSAAEAYILGESKSDLGSVPTSRITIGQDGPMWENATDTFTCAVSNPEKQSKFSGLKSYIAYNITPSFSNKRVLRRFKHFDWLYEQLFRKFNLAISIPPLPDKQITGRYETEFIEERRVQLEAWLGRICLHPVISRSEVLQHFLTSKDSEKAWKAGKRKAEKDEAAGGALLNTFEPPSDRLDLTVAEQTLETHNKFTKSMDDACKQLLAIAQDQSKKYHTVYRNEYEKMGQLFVALGESFELDEREVAKPLTGAMKRTGQFYHDIAEMQGDQPKYDWHPFATGLNEYKTVLSTFPAILLNQKSALDKNRDIRRMHHDGGKVSSEEMEDVAARTEKLSYAVQAELNHFQHYRVGDFAGYMKNFLDQRVEYHRAMANKLEEAAADYSSLVQS